VSKVRCLTDDEQTVFALLKKFASFLLVGMTPAARKRAKGVFKGVKKVDGYNVLRVGGIGVLVKGQLFHSFPFLDRWRYLWPNTHRSRMLRFSMGGHFSCGVPNRPEVSLYSF
jgi:hypothetical protein